MAAPRCSVAAQTPLVPTTQPGSTSLRGVVDAVRRPVASLVSGSKHMSAGTGITERRGNLRDPGPPYSVPKSVSIPVKEARHLGACELPALAIHY